MRVFISGPVTNIPGYNREAFQARADALRAAGHQVIDPHGLIEFAQRLGKLGPEPTWDECMSITLPWVFRCDAISLLPGWKDSKGARIEEHLASARGMPHVDAAGRVV